MTPAAAPDKHCCSERFCYCELIPVPASTMSKRDQSIRLWLRCPGHFHNTFFTTPRPAVPVPSSNVFHDGSSLSAGSLARSTATRMSLRSRRQSLTMKMTCTCRRRGGRVRWSCIRSWPSQSGRRVPARRRWLPARRRRRPLGRGTRSWATTWRRQRRSSGEGWSG